MIGYLVVEQLCQLPDNSALGLAARAEENGIVFGQDGVDYLRDNAFFIPDDAAKKLFAAAKLFDKVGAHLVLYRTRHIPARF